MVSFYEVVVELAEKLTAITPESLEEKAVLVSKEQNLLKTSRAHTGRRGVIFLMVFFTRLSQSVVITYR